MKKYDVNKDGRVDQKDATRVQKYIAKLILQFKNCDVNGDGEVNIEDYKVWRAQFDFADIDRNGKLDDADVTRIQEAIAGLRSKENSMDINQDGSIGMLDVCKLQQLLNATSDFSKKLDILDNDIVTEADGLILSCVIEELKKAIETMDVNKDGKVNMSDVVEIQQNFD